MIITRPRKGREYVLESERDLPTEEQTVFLLDDLKERDRVKVMDSFAVGQSEDGTTIRGTGTRTYLVLKGGLRGWRNLTDDTGLDVPCGLEGNVITDASLEMLPWSVKDELVGEIMRSNVLDASDKEK